MKVLEGYDYPRPTAPTVACLKCGAMIGDQEQHDQWHEELLKVLKDATGQGEQ